MDPTHPHGAQTSWAWRTTQMYVLVHSTLQILAHHICRATTGILVAEHTRELLPASFDAPGCLNECNSSLMMLHSYGKSTLLNPYSKSEIFISFSHLI